MNIDDNRHGKDKSEMRQEIEKAINAGNAPVILRFLLAAIGGGVPFVGGVAGAASGWWSDHEQDRVNKLFEAWLQLQQEEIEEIGQTLIEVIERLDFDDPAVQERVESRAYLNLIRKAFRDWSAAASEEKRCLIRNLLANAGAATQLCPDDVIRMFIKWIDEYEESHFKVVRAIYNHNGITRGQIWQEIHGERVPENSAEADLYKLLFRDLSTGGVIRQHRPTDAQGNFLKQSSNKRSSRRGNPYFTSAFEDNKPYELTALGEQFVHYTMNEIVPRIDATSQDSSETDATATV